MDCPKKMVKGVMKLRVSDLACNRNGHKTNPENKKTCEKGCYQADPENKEGLRNWPA